MDHIDGSRAMLDFLLQDQVQARRMSYCDGQTVFEPKDPATDLFIIEAGEVRTFEVGPNGAKGLLDILGPGRCLGFASIGGLEKYEKLALSVGQTTVRVIPAQGMHEILHSHSELAKPLIETLARQLHEGWADGSHFVFQDCRLRVIKTLLRFADSPAARSVPEGVELRMTHAKLTQAVGGGQGNRQPLPDAVAA